MPDRRDLMSRGYYVAHAYQGKTCKRCGTRRRRTLSGWEWRARDSGWSATNPPCARRPTSRSTDNAATPSRRGRVGAVVRYCGHDATFIADVIEVGGACVVVANGPIDEHLSRPASERATHHLVDLPTAGYWNPRKGIFVVPSEQVKVLDVRGDRSAS